MRTRAVDHKMQLSGSSRWLCLTLVLLCLAPAPATADCDSCGPSTTCDDSMQCVADCSDSECCTAGPCSNTDITACVGEFDPFCKTDWDPQCASEAQQACGLNCGTGTDAEMLQNLPCGNQWTTTARYEWDLTQEFIDMDGDYLSDREPWSPGATGMGLNEMSPELAEEVWLPLETITGLTRGQIMDKLMSWVKHTSGEPILHVALSDFERPEGYVEPKPAAGVDLFFTTATAGPPQFRPSVPYKLNMSGGGVIDEGPVIFVHSKQTWDWAFILASYSDGELVDAVWGHKPVSSPINFIERNSDGFPGTATWFSDYEQMPEEGQVPGLFITSKTRAWGVEGEGRIPGPSKF